MPVSEDDLARLVGDAPARELSRFGRSVAGAMREAVRAIGSVASRLRGAGGPRRPATLVLARHPPRIDLNLHVCDIRYRVDRQPREVIDAEGRQDDEHCRHAG